MNPGDTFFGFDRRGHLWMVLTAESTDGEVVIANFTTHDPGIRPTCDADCLVVQPGDHPYPRHDSCIFFQGAMLTSNRALRIGVAEGVYDPQAQLSPALLNRVRKGALESELTAEPIKTAIRRGHPQ